MTTKKAAKTAAADSTQDILKDAIKLYEDALKNGIKLQEESLQLWKDMLAQVGTPDELREKLEKMTGGVFPETRKNMDDILKVFQDNANQSMDLFNKAMGICRADSWKEGQTLSQDLMESSLKAMSSNVKTLLDTNTKMMASWTDIVEKMSAKTF
jgi:polyhydroxyalkanoate synthesis regulator protein